MRSVDEVKAYATKVRTILRYIGVNSGDMEKGAVRFESNVSIRPARSPELFTRTEIKNLNSFRALVHATEYEIARQIRVVESGGQVEQETMGWNDARRDVLPARQGTRSRLSLLSRARPAAARDFARRSRAHPGHAARVARRQARPLRGAVWAFAV